MSKGLLAFAAGFGNGYLDEKRQQEMDGERKADRANRQQEFDARMDEVKQAKSLRMGLADAARPATVNENAAILDVSGKPVVYEDAGVANSDFRQARTMGLADAQAPRQTASVNGKAYASTGEADAAAVAYNQPQARTARLSDAYMAGGQPMQAMQLGSAAQSQKAGAIGLDRAEFDLKRSRDEEAKKWQAEGLVETAKVARSGDPQAVFDSFNKQGGMKLAAPPKATLVERDIQGYGKVKSYDYEGEVIGADGQAKPFRVNSHDLSMQTMPFDRQMDMQGKGSAANDKQVYQQGRLDNMGLARAGRGDGGRAQEDKSELRLANQVNAAEKSLLAAETAAQKKFGDPSTTAAISDKGMAAYTESKNAFLAADPEINTRRERLKVLRDRQDNLYGDEAPATKPLGLTDAKPAAPATPQGMTLVGKTPDGRMVYRTKDGKQVVGN